MSYSPNSYFSVQVPKNVFSKILFNGQTNKIFKAFYPLFDILNMQQQSKLPAAPSRSSDEEQSAASAQPGSSCSHRACDSWMNTCESAVYFAVDQGSLNTLNREFNCAVQNKSKSWSETDRTLHFTWKHDVHMGGQLPPSWPNCWRTCTKVPSWEPKKCAKVPSWLSKHTKVSSWGPKHVLQCPSF